jgi:hypothetical protein
VATPVPGRRTGLITKLKPLCLETFAEVDILKPERMEVLIESPDIKPSDTPE